MHVSPPPIKVWALEQGVRVFQPESLRDSGTHKILRDTNSELFVVIAYARIIPKEVLEIPKHGTINLHPSLLPKFRGPSPIRSAILADDRENIGVSVMLLDEEMDHGPLLAQKKMEIAEEYWPIRGEELDKGLARLGGAVLADVIPKWINGEVEPKEQDHDEATYTKKLTKEMGELDLSDDPHQNLLKIRAFDGWPGTYFFTEKNGKRTRVKVTDAEFDHDGSLHILKVIPEGKKEIPYDQFKENK
jgi:methionyl-tRNA formyltransferase